MSGVAPDQSGTDIKPRFLAPAEVSESVVCSLHTSDTIMIHICCVSFYLKCVYAVLDYIESASMYPHCVRP